MNHWYVYIGYLEDQVVYVGKGSGNRLNHLNSGISSSYAANQNHFLGETPVNTIKHASFMDEVEAFLFESKLIIELNPLWNKDGSILYESPQKVVSSEARKRMRNPKSTSNYYGVSFRNVAMTEDYRPWLATYNCNGSRYIIGRYCTELEAAIARDEKIKELELKRPLNFT